MARSSRRLRHGMWMRKNNRDALQEVWLMRIHLLRVSEPPAAGAEHRSVAVRQRLAAKASSADTIDATVKYHAHGSERLGVDAASAKAQQVAEVIRRRRDDGFYHRPEVLQAVTERLLQSGDLEHVG